MMPKSDSQRILDQMQAPRITALWRALQPLKSVVSFMNSGAHPDDETSAMLAALSYRDGLSLSYACANRGEGGQNDIGTETTRDLGVLRSAEMERAAEVLNLRLYWLSETPQDSIFDFGFSKSGEETLARWGAERTLKRFVEIVRSERPDILCPTFLDIPGQHGHHRAMTQMAHQVMDAAAAPDFPEVALAPWQVKKLYLPAWSGAGDAYDDDLPPPPATLTVDANGEDPVTGWSWAQIGQQSRVFHRTQGMGRWVPHGAGNSWPLHLARSFVSGGDDTLSSGLPADLQALAEFADAGAFSGALQQAHAACRTALESFPHFNAVLKAATQALKAIRIAYRSCPAVCQDEVLHRLLLKEAQLSRVIRIAAGVELRATLEKDALRPGEAVRMEVETKPSANRAVEITCEAVLAEGWQLEGDMLSVSALAPVSDPYPSRYIPGDAAAPAMRLLVTHDGVTSQTRIGFEIPPLVLPARSAAMVPDRAVINVAASERQLAISLGDIFPDTAKVELVLPDQSGTWQSVRSATGLTLIVPQDVMPGLYDIPVHLDGQPAQSVHHFAYHHITPRIRTFPAGLQLRVIDAALPDAAIAYVGGGNDRVPHWLNAIGLTVTELTDDQLTEADLSRFDTLLIGIFAMRTRPALRACMPVVHSWVEQGGHLVTLYHRPRDGWEPDKVPPRHLEIGKPSLRWRVTDENAEVTHLLPQHSLLNTPNRIEAADWAGWHKERGLYFARSWAGAYKALLSMADPGEEPHCGALLSARIGYGRHTHTSLILHHQMEKLTPGAFRLMANLVAKA